MVCSWFSHPSCSGSQVFAVAVVVAVLFWLSLLVLVCGLCCSCWPWWSRSYCCCFFFSLHLVSPVVIIDLAVAVGAVVVTIVVPVAIAVHFAVENNPWWKHSSVESNNICQPKNALRWSIHIPKAFRNAWSIHVPYTLFDFLNALD